MTKKVVFSDVPVWWTRKNVNSFATLFVSGIPNHYNYIYTGKGAALKVAEDSHDRGVVMVTVGVDDALVENFIRKLFSQDQLINMDDFLDLAKWRNFSIASFLSIALIKRILNLEFGINQ